MKLRKPSPAIKRILANKIKHFRMAQGLSQEQFAELCGIHRTYVGSVEREERNVTLSSLEIFANALNISVVELLTEAIKSD